MMVRLGEDVQLRDDAVSLLLPPVGPGRVPAVRWTAPAVEGRFVYRVEIETGKCGLADATFIPGHRIVRVARQDDLSFATPWTLWLT
jgi:hypothetical protein